VETQGVWSDDDGIESLCHPAEGIVCFDLALLLIDGLRASACLPFSRTGFDKTVAVKRYIL